jgi:hypothetical protein
MADALLLGWLAGGEVAQKTQREYMRRHPRPYMKIVHAVMSDDMLSASPLDLLAQPSTPPLPSPSPSPSPSPFPSDSPLRVMLWCK